MNWIVIVLILIAAFGPVLWILPSRRDRRLAKMRSRARVLGMQVELTQLPDLAAEPTARVTAGGRRLEPMLSCAVYRLPMLQPARAAPHWRLLRSASDAAGPHAGWQWDSPVVGDGGYWRTISAVLDELPVDALACSAQATEVACWWLERAPAETAEAAVDSLHVVLRKLSEVQRVADAAKQLVDGAADPDGHPTDDG